MSDYSAGTITLVNNSQAVVGVGTAWNTAGVTSGVIYVEAAGNPLPFAIVNSNTSITAAVKWKGASGTYPYTLVRSSAYAQQTAKNAERLGELLQGLSAPAVAALSSLTPAVNQLPYFTGSDTAALTTLSAFARTLLDTANAAVFYGALGQIPNAQVRNDLTSDKAFRRGNVLGAVSQSGGVPTNGMFERGSNVNGEYVRIADGTLICTNNSITIKPDGDNAVGTKTTEWLFPATFTVQPCVFHTISTTVASSRGRVSATTTAAAATLSYLEETGTSALIRTRAAAIGRWF